ncbi:hypothetical protein ACFSTH_05965 [Paenibacillus yanchengensis]|uniref:Copper amine oxidase-like N-terminal domain-containing protein n=1 Tax=Paenibacillus yanchengensis TaxID=2035833 RepID=A0ABW4YHQ4_9BACL
MNNKKSVIFLLLIFVLITSNLPNSASAASASSIEKGGIIINSQTESIELLLDIPGAYFIVTDHNNDELILYEGSETNIIIAHLEPDTMQRYNLFSYDKNNSLIEVFYLSTHTKSKHVNNRSKTDTYVDMNAMDLVVSKNRVSLRWDATPNVSQYSIYKNSKLVVTTKDTQYVDTSDMMEDNITYEVAFEVPFTDAEKAELKSHYEKSIGKISDAELNEISNKPYSIIRIVDTSSIEKELDRIPNEHLKERTFKQFIKKFLWMLLA